jgi:hypothetical protein
MIRFHCPTCGKPYSAAEELAGRNTVCNQCSHVFCIPHQPKPITKSQQVVPPPIPSPPAVLEAADYPRMRRRFALVQARRKVRTILDTSGFGPSTLGRLCLALILGAFLFGGSLALSLAYHHTPMNAIVQAGAFLLTAFVGVSILILGPSDQELAAQSDYLVTALTKTEAAWWEYKNQLVAERHKRKLDRAKQQEEVRQLASSTRAHPPITASASLQHNQVINVSVNMPLVLPTKSVALALLLAFFFGPLGMLYSTVAGGIIMFFLSFFLAISTCGLSLFVTWPICVIWSAVAADSYNRQLARGQS